jgi:hypothetical protein
LPAGTYIVLIWDCKEWALSAIRYGIKNSKSRKPGYNSFCKCTITYMQEDTGYVRTTVAGQSTLIRTIESDALMYMPFEQP